MPRILLVEDNEMNRDMLSRRLSRRGFEVSLALDGPSGLAEARSGSFDLILMDLSLPGLDGWTVARMLKDDPTTRQIPVIALTAHAMTGDRERAIEAGCDDYEIKPIEFPRLLAKIEAILRQKGPPMLFPDNLSTTTEAGIETMSLLRHDLITPLSRILGYSELLMEDADAQGRLSRVQSFRSIRVFGKEALATIDRTLIPHPSSELADLAELVPGVVAPAHAIISVCDALEASSSRIPGDFDFLEDLAKVRQDAVLLIEMVQGTAIEAMKVRG